MTVLSANSNRGAHFVPVTPPRTQHANLGVSPMQHESPIYSPKGRDLRSVTSMPSMQSFNSITHPVLSHESANYADFDVLEFARFAPDADFDLDPLQTPDLDPLSPTFYDQFSPQLQHQPLHNLHNNAPQQHPHNQEFHNQAPHPLLTPELSGSVGSGTSLSGISQIGSNSSIMSIAQTTNNQHANLMASNIEGLGIAEPGSSHYTSTAHAPQTQWPASPEGPTRRGKQPLPPRVAKKSSKQTLKQRRSRPNLNESNPSNRSTSPTSTISSRSSMVSLPSPSKHMNINHNLLATSPEQPPPPPRPNTSLSLSAAQFTHNSSIEQHPQMPPQMPPQMQPQMPSQMPPPQQQQHAVPRPHQIQSLQQQQQPQAHSQFARARIQPVTPYNADSLGRRRGKAAASPAMQSPLRPAQLSRVSPKLERQPRLPAAAAATALFSPAAPPPDLTRQNSMAAAAAAAAAASSASSQQQPVTPLADRQIPRVSPSTIVLSNNRSGNSTIKVAHAGTTATAAPSPTPAARMHSSSKLVASASDSSPAKGMWQQAPRAPIPLDQLPKPVLSPRKSASTSNMRRDTRRKQKVIPEMSSSLNQFQVDLKPKQRASRTSLHHRPAKHQQHQQNQQQQHQQQHHHNQTAAPVDRSKMLSYQLTPADGGFVPHRQSMPEFGVAPPQFDPLFAAGNTVPAPRQSVSPPRPQTAPLVHAGELERVQPQGEPLQHVWASRPQAQTAGRQPRSTHNENTVAGARHTKSAEYPQMHLIRQQQMQLLGQDERLNPERLQHLHAQEAAYAQTHQHHQPVHQPVQHQPPQHQQAQHQPVQHQPAHQPAQGPPLHRPLPLMQQQINEAQQRKERTQQYVPAENHQIDQQNAEQHDEQNAAQQHGDGVQDISVSSDFMAQFINDDWNTNDIDIDGDWDFMDALETPI